MSNVDSRTLGSRKKVRQSSVARQKHEQISEEMWRNEKETQTSKTIIQLAQQDLEARAKAAYHLEGNINKNKDEIKEGGSNDLHFEGKSDMYYSSLDMPTIEQEAKKKGLSLTRLFLSKHDQEENHPSYTDFQVASTIDQQELCNVADEKTVEEVFTVPRWSRFHIREIRVKSIDAANNLLIQDYKKATSTGSVPESISFDEDPEHSIRSQMSSSRRGRSLSPPSRQGVQSYESTNSNSLESYNLDSIESVKTKDYFHSLINQVKSNDWYEISIGKL